ncbi:MAG: monovalent cation/H+ antiporter complex subunit F [Bowdeniella nasicola]|nr:monovalent cation/H+ antiporter complex subunit F [Bowdeniella nasicola]
MRSGELIAYLTRSVEYLSFFFLVLAVGIVLIRMLRGRSMLDRAVAMDVVTSAMIGAVAVWAALTHRLDLIPTLVALALVGFIGTTSIARFAVIDNPEEAKASPGSEQADAVVELDDDAAPVHDPDAASTQLDGGRKA